MRCSMVYQDGCWPRICGRLEGRAFFQEASHLLREPAPYALFADVRGYYTGIAVIEAHVYQVRKVQPTQILLRPRPLLIQQILQESTIRGAPPSWEEGGLYSPEVEHVIERGGSLFGTFPVKDKQTPRPQPGVPRSEITMG